MPQRPNIQPWFVGYSDIVYEGLAVMRSITAAVLLATLFTMPAMAQSWGVQQGSWNVPRIPSTNLSGSWGVKSESYGVKPELWGVKSEYCAISVLLCVDVWGGDTKVPTVGTGLDYGSSSVQLEIQYWPQGIFPATRNC